MGTALNIGENDPSLHACTSTCQVSDKNKWRCKWVEEVAGNGKYISDCEWLCGNQKVNVDEDEGLYLGRGQLAADPPTGTFVAMSDPEECDFGGWFWTGETKSGYKNHDAGFNKDPNTNTALLLGCTENCKLESTFRCPLADDIKW